MYFYPLLNKSKSGEIRWSTTCHCCNETETYGRIAKWSNRGCALVHVQNGQGEVARYCTFKCCPKPTQLDHKHLVKRHFVSELKPGCLESNVLELCLSGRAIYKCIWLDIGYHHWQICVIQYTKESTKRDYILESQQIFQTLKDNLKTLQATMKWRGD